VALISPTDQKKFDRDPREGDIPTGMYLCELTAVREVPPSAKFPNGNNRLVFEFTIADGPQRGKKPVIFLGKTLLKSKEGRESKLVQFARMMGIAAPEKGFDPDTLLHKKYQVMVEYTPGASGEPGRGWVRSAMVAAPAAAATTSAPPPADLPPAPDAPPAPDPAALWDLHNGKEWLKGRTTADVCAHLATSGVGVTHLWVRPAGNTLAPKRAHEYGFAAPDSEVPIPY
jgi:hypothetical protein